MYIEYSYSKLGNVGDDLNPWMFPKLVPELFENQDDKIAFLGIGTILDQRRVKNSKLNDNVANVVFSSGAGFSDTPVLDDDWHVYCVRGPHTAKKMNQEKSKAIADGAYLLRNIIDYKNVEKKHKVSFIPHHRSEDFTDWQKICDRCGMKMITTRQSVESFIDELLASELIVTEAMHGAIIADALRVPWIPVSYSPKFMHEKWHDFSAAVGLELKINPIPFFTDKTLGFSKSIENATKRGLFRLGVGHKKWKNLPNSYFKANSKQIESLCAEIIKTSESGERYLSSDSVVEEVTEKLNLCLQVLYEDYKSGLFFKEKRNDIEASS